MINSNHLPTLEFEVGAPGTAQHVPVVIGQVIVGVIIGIAIAVTNEG